MLAQAFALAQITAPFVMQTKEGGDLLVPQQGQEGVTTEPPIGQRQVTGFELIEQPV
jgi:hypothetical protein